MGTRPEGCSVNICGKLSVVGLRRLSIKRKQDRYIRVITKEQTNQPTNQQFSWSGVLIEKTRSSSISQETPHILWTRRFITVFTKTHHLSLPCARANPVHFFPPYFLKIHFNITPSTSRSSKWPLSLSPLPKKVANALIMLTKYNFFLWQVGEDAQGVSSPLCISNLQ